MKGNALIGIRPKVNKNGMEKIDINDLVLMIWSDKYKDYIQCIFKYNTNGNPIMKLISSSGEILEA